MTFTSYQFFLFLPAALLIYFLIPGKLRTLWLVMMSFAFIWYFNPKYLLILLVSAGISYGTALILDQINGKADREEDGKTAGGENKAQIYKKKKTVAAAGILSVIGILILFKYMDFLLENINQILHLSGEQVIANPFSLIAPVGIAYYTLQVIGYIVDVYRGKIRAERNILCYLLYVAYFPKIISGPIERADAFLEQTHDCKNWRLWNWERISAGLILMVWGYFQKLVIADRLAIFVEEIFKNYMQYGTIELVAGITLFFIQLYADFLGYMNIAQGVSNIMGFTLQENFNAPYFAKSVREYWSRWHISLSTWLKDYVYIPLGGNRKGLLRKNSNLVLTFLVSGLWHGASWSFLFWGGIHGIYQIGEHWLEPVADRVNEKLHTRTESFGYKLMQIIKTWILNLSALIFFKCNTARDAIAYIGRIFSKWDPWVIFDGSLYTFGVDEKYFKVVVLSVILFFIVDWMKYKRGERIDSWLSRQCIWFRWGFLMMLILACVVFGAYGPAYDAGNFIYFQFN